MKIKDAETQATMQAIIDTADQVLKLSPESNANTYHSTPDHTTRADDGTVTVWLEDRAVDSSHSVIRTLQVRDPKRVSEASIEGATVSRRIGSYNIRQFASTILRDLQTLIPGETTPSTSGTE